MLRTASSKTLFRSLAPSARAFSGTAARGQEDVVIIGGGPGGYVAAIKAGQLGMKVTCVEKRGTLGGTCLNVGCIPSKALLHASHLYHDAEHAFEHNGIKVDGLSYDWDVMQDAKSKAIGGLTQGIEGLFKKNKVTYVKGEGTITGPGKVSVKTLDGGTEELSAKSIVIATGSEPSTIPGVTIDEEKVVSSTGALSLKEVPKKLCLIGGGVIGLEMGSVYARMGSEVTCVEFLDRIVPTEDHEVSKTFMNVLKKQGFNFKLKHAVKSVEYGANGLVVTAEDMKKSETVTLDADIVLVATGRRPNTDNLGLEKIGVAQDKIGRVITDDHFKTNIDGIYAIGDVIAGPMLAHKAEEEGIACVDVGWSRWTCQLRCHPWGRLHPPRGGIRW
jgi:dihydrolipoamide dehydrogenase